jgi:prolyl oligopeptidase
MKRNIYLIILFVPFFLGTSFLSGEEQQDPYLWLEEIEGEEALNWVNIHNNTTTRILKRHPEFKEINKKILDILNSKDRIAYPSIKGDYVYNFWQDDSNERGVWRRTQLTKYIGDDPEWETVLDLDILSKEEGEKWAFKGATFLYPEFDICMVSLSRGGSDAVEIREFDLRKNEFVDNGFYLSEAKGNVSWIDKNTLIVSTNFGEGTTTNSGYPRVTRIWKRATSLEEAKTLLAGEETDVRVFGFVQDTPERQYILVARAITFYTSNQFVLEDDTLIKLDIPEDAQFHGFFKNQLLVELKSDWSINEKTYNQGALISIDYNKFLDGDRNFEVIFEPDKLSSLVEISNTKNYLLINKLTSVSSELSRYSLEDSKWNSVKINLQDYGTISIISTDDFSDQYFINYQNFLTPSSLYFAHDNDPEMIKIKSLPHFFDCTKFEVKQFEAKSRDNTQIPYFVVLSKKTKFNGSNPTLLYAYGGFEISVRPGYSPIIGSSWLEKGGIYVLANIRGGGEFGPKWHRSALKENRQKAYDDFIAVSEDLIQRKITLPKHLGIMGGSNGGLLVGVAFTQRPDLYNAVVCSAPVLDMKRYNKLLAGASWMAEYGNPDIPEEWEYIKKYSPFHNLSASKKYPKVFFTTTTRDDRVHPGHARKMVAKMEDQGHDLFYFENTEGGHGAGVTNEQRAFMASLEFTYLLKMLR